MVSAGQGERCYQRVVGTQVHYVWSPSGVTWLLAGVLRLWYRGTCTRDDVLSLCLGKQIGGVSSSISWKAQVVPPRRESHFIGTLFWREEDVGSNIACDTDEGWSWLGFVMRGLSWVGSPVGYPCEERWRQVLDLGSQPGRRGVRARMI